MKRSEVAPTHLLYRCYDKSGVLLFIGSCIANPDTWLWIHINRLKRMKPWGKDIDKVTTVPVGASIADGKRKYVVKERPLYN